MPYDLLFKFEGIKALCEGDVTDDLLNLILFPNKEIEDRRSSLSKLKSAELRLTLEHKNALVEHFNDHINRYLLRRNEPNPAGGILRADDWDLPLPEFFGRLAQHLDGKAPAALDRAHEGVKEAFARLTKYRQKDHALLIQHHDAAKAEQYRIPVSAAAMDPILLPAVPLKHAHQMTALLTRPVTAAPAKGWLFYVRDPDQRRDYSLGERIWDQSLDKLVFWHAANPFEIPAGYVGPLPGFPEEIADLPGQVTGYLVIEASNGRAVADLLRKPAPDWDGVSAPPFESFAHLVTCAKRLFDKAGNSPRLYMRTYSIS